MRKMKRKIIVFIAIIIIPLLVLLADRYLLKSSINVNASSHQWNYIGQSMKNIH